MDLDADRCYQACTSNDARFDGRFFAAVRTTGIYCRSVCPAPRPLRKNIEFFPTAAAAEQAGFRACRRCRPDASPGTPAWHGTSAIVTRGLRMIDAGVLDEEGVPALSRKLGIGERHLSRLFVRHLGTSPIAIAQTRRVHFGKRLIEESTLPMARIALTAGFSSVRRFNASMKKSFGLSPMEIRRRAGERLPGSSARLDLRLSYRPPLQWRSLLAFLGQRATPGVETIRGTVYRRTVRIDGETGIIEVRPFDHRSVSLRITGSLSRCVLAIAEKVRDLFDLRADPHTIGTDLMTSGRLKRLIGRRPIPRVPGAWDGFELAVRAILGQQVSVKAATTIAGRLAARYGEPVLEGAQGLKVLFPTPQALASDGIRGCGLPQARARAVTGLARAVSEGDLELDTYADPDEVRAKLRSIPGIGEWTAEYIVMRALSHPDAFPRGDLGLRKALSENGRPLPAKDLSALAEEWRPWRAYAAMLLWNSLT